ncbi:hypothetical protein I548_2180 [Mycobacterium intracellulare]|nr:hypothetical protein I548_2180 [Mycobacterium intracellulare]
MIVPPACGSGRSSSTTRSSRSPCHDRAGADDVVPDPLGRAGGRRGGVPGLKMKMIFSKVRPCCEAARRAAVSMPKMRLNPLQNVLIGGRRRAVQW